MYIYIPSIDIHLVHLPIPPWYLVSVSPPPIEEKLRSLLHLLRRVDRDARWALKTCKNIWDVMGISYVYMCIYVCIYIYIYMYVCVYIYMYMFRIRVIPMDSERCPSIVCLVCNISSEVSLFRHVIYMHVYIYIYIYIYCIYHVHYTHHLS